MSINTGIDRDVVKSESEVTQSCLTLQLFGPPGSSIQVLAMVNSATITMECMYLFKLWFSLDVCPGVGLLDHMTTLFLFFWGTTILSSIVAAPIYIPTKSVGGFHILTLSPAFIICGLFDDGHSDECEVIPHYSFDLPFSNNWDLSANLFHSLACLFCHSIAQYYHLFLENYN